MAIAIRASRPGDETRLRAIHLAATMSSYGRELVWLEPILGDPGTPLEPADWTIVAEVSGVALGYAAVTRSHLENLFVDPAAQGRGIGAALLAAVEVRLADRFDLVTLRCLHANRSARRFYDRHGYAVRETQTILLHGRPLPAWFMEKSLDALDSAAR
jgi:ribosomal protein S18 acetylase RimI-like enzyme